jgi:hypothetical protein
MSTVKQIEDQVSQLTQAELERFRAWYAEFDADAWDRQIEQDVVAGKLDGLAGAALREHGAGSTRSL